MEQEANRTTLRRFVVLRHEIGPMLERTSVSHLDWMFEIDGRLRTFATELVDPLAASVNVVAESLADHRISYLDFEGEISGGRGRVTRVARGKFELLDATDKRWHARLDWEPSEEQVVPTTDQPTGDYRIRSELWVGDVRGVLQFRLSATR